MTLIRSDRGHYPVACSICQHEPAAFKSVIVNPLVDAVTTFVGLDCYTINARATAEILASDPALQLTEVRV